MESLANPKRSPLGVQSEAVFTDVYVDFCKTKKINRFNPHSIKSFTRNAVSTSSNYPDEVELNNGHNYGNDFQAISTSL